MRQADLGHVEAKTGGVVVEVMQLINVGVRVIEVLAVEAIQDAADIDWARLPRRNRILSVQQRT